MLSSSFWNIFISRKSKMLKGFFFVWQRTQHDKYCGTQITISRVPVAHICSWRSFLQSIRCTEKVFVMQRGTKVTCVSEFTLICTQDIICYTAGLSLKKIQNNKRKNNHYYSESEITDRKCGHDQLGITLTLNYRQQSKDFPERKVPKFICYNPSFHRQEMRPVPLELTWPVVNMC